MAKKEFTADFAKWNGTVPANVRFMIEDPATGQKYYVTYEQILSMDIDIPDLVLTDVSGKPVNSRFVSKQFNNTPDSRNIAISMNKGALGGFATGLNTALDTIAIGNSVLGFDLRSEFNTVVGVATAISALDSKSNSLFGRGVLFKHPSPQRCNAVGREAFYELLSGSDLVGIGFNAGRFIRTGALCTSLSSSVLIGNNARPKANGDTNEIIIGDNAIGEGSNTAVFGNTATTKTFLRGQLDVKATSPSVAGSSIQIMEGYVYGTGTNFRAFAPGDVLYANFDLFNENSQEIEPFEGIFPILSITDNVFMIVDNASGLDVTTITEFSILRSSVSKSAVDTFMGSHKMLGAEFNVNAAVVPQYDAFYNLGNSVRRWNQLFSSTGTISTSDQRVKTPIRDFEYNERNAAVQMSREIGMFKFLDAVRQKGDKARTHIGMSVQRAIEILEQNNLNPFDYAFICYDEWETKTIEHPAVEAVDAWTEEIKDEEDKVIETIQHEAIPGVDAWTETVQVAGDLFSFRYDQLLAFICKGIDERLRILEGV